MVMEGLIKEKGNISVLISYPNLAIKSAWEEEVERLGNKVSITYTTHISLSKNIKSYDLVIIDEIHLLSSKQIENLNEISKINNQILGLTGTMSDWTEKTLLFDAGMPVISRYFLEKAIEEGVVTDYRINILTVPLDNTVKQKYGKYLYTEKDKFKSLSIAIDKMLYNSKDPFYLRLQRARVIQNSIAKISATKKLLSIFSKDRVLVFCGSIKVAEQIPPCFHSKSKDKELLDKFLKGDINNISLIKIGNTGVTYPNLKRVIINYFDSNPENMAQKINRCMALEYNNTDKVAEIWIVCTDEKVEKKWLEKALEFFDTEKISYYEESDYPEII